MTTKAWSVLKFLHLGSRMLARDLGSRMFGRDSITCLARRFPKSETNHLAITGARKTDETTIAAATAAKVEHLLSHVHD